MKTATQTEREAKQLQIVKEDPATDCQLGHLYVHVLDATLTRSLDCYIVLLMGDKAFRMNHSMAGVFHTYSSQPKFGGLARWIDPPQEGFSIRLELWERHLMKKDTLLGMPEVQGTVSEFTNKWKTLAADVGKFGVINFRFFWRPSGSVEPSRDELFELAEDTNDPIPDDEGDSLTTIGTEALELRDHIGGLTDFIAHVQRVIMWRAPKAECAMVMFGTIFLAWKNWLLPGAFLGLWIASLAFFLRNRTGIEDKEDLYAQTKLRKEEKDRIKEKKKEVDPSVKTKLRLAVGGIRDFNAIWATAMRFLTVDTPLKLGILAGGALGAALVLYFLPLRLLLIPGVFYLFTVQSMYMNFPNLKKRYFWPDMLKQQITLLKERYFQKKTAPLAENSTKSVPASISEMATKQILSADEQPPSAAVADSITDNTSNKSYGAGMTISSQNTYMIGDKTYAREMETQKIKTTLPSGGKMTTVIPGFNDKEPGTMDKVKEKVHVASEKAKGVAYTVKDSVTHAAQKVGIMKKEEEHVQQLPDTLLNAPVMQDYIEAPVIASGPVEEAQFSSTTTHEPGKMEMMKEKAKDVAHTVKEKIGLGTKKEEEHLVLPDTLLNSSTAPNIAMAEINIPPPVEEATIDKSTPLLASATSYHGTDSLVQPSSPSMATYGSNDSTVPEYLQTDYLKSLAPAPKSVLTGRIAEFDWKSSMTNTSATSPSSYESNVPASTIHAKPEYSESMLNDDLLDYLTNEAKPASIGMYTATPDKALPSSMPSLGARENRQTSAFADPMTRDLGA